MGAPADKNPSSLDVSAYDKTTGNYTPVQDTHLKIGSSGKNFYFTPQLNITAFWLGASDASFTSDTRFSDNGSYQIVSSLNFSGNGVLNTSQLRFTDDWNQTNPTFFTLSDIEDRGSCQPVSNVSPCAAFEPPSTNASTTRPTPGVSLSSSSL